MYGMLFISIRTVTDVNIERNALSRELSSAGEWRCPGDVIAIGWHMCLDVA